MKKKILKKRTNLFEGKVEYKDEYEEEKEIQRLKGKEKYYVKKKKKKRRRTKRK